MLRRTGLRSAHRVGLTPKRSTMLYMLLQNNTRVAVISKSTLHALQDGLLHQLRLEVYDRSHYQSA